MKPWPANWRTDPRQVARAQALVRQYGRDKALAIVNGTLPSDDPLHADLTRWERIAERGQPLPPRPKRGN